MGAAFKRKRWREEHRVRVDLNGVMAEIIGDAGLRDSDIEALLPRLTDVHTGLETQGRSGKLAFAELPHGARDLKRTLALVDEVRGQFDDLVVLGLGDAALGASALTAGLGAGPSGDALSAPAMRVHVADAADPRSCAALLDRLDLRRTLFNVISKSGDTTETLTAFMVVRDRLLRELGAVEYKSHLVATTDATHGALRQVVNDEGFRALAISPHVSGPFSILSAAGVFPAACAGVDVAELLAGAADMDTRCRVPDARGNPALFLAGVSHLARMRDGCGDLTLRPYARELGGLAIWFDRVWSECIGGTIAHGAGSTPHDVIVFVRVEEHATTLAVPKSYEDIEAIAYLGGQALGALLNLQQQAAEIARGKAGRLSATIVCPRLNPFVVGQLIHLLETAAATVGSMAAREAAAPDHPDDRHLVYGLAGRAGYESDRAEAQRWLARKDARYVV